MKRKFISMIAVSIFLAISTCAIFEFGLSVYISEPIISIEGQEIDSSILRKEYTIKRLIDRFRLALTVKNLQSEKSFLWEYEFSPNNAMPYLHVNFWGKEKRIILIGEDGMEYGMLAQKVGQEEWCLKVPLKEYAELKKLIYAMIEKYK